MRVACAAGAAAALCVLVASCSAFDSESTATPISDAGPQAQEAEAAAPANVDDAGPMLAADAAPPIACPVGCLPFATPGWSGPSAVYDGPDTAAECSGLYPAVESEGRRGGKAPTPTCACAAGTPSGTSCNSVDVFLWTTGDCANSPANPAKETVTANLDVQCRPYTASFFSMQGGPVTGTCLFQSPTITKGPITYEGRVVACGLPQLASCEGRADCTATPLPLPDKFTRLCIYRPGDELCPSADYPARTLVHKTWTDTRICDRCTGKVMGTCQPPVTRQIGACNGTTTTTPDYATCERPQEPFALTFPAIFQPGPTSCTGTSAPKGGLEPSEPITFCCNR